jgi:hypothetical protein
MPPRNQPARRPSRRKKPVNLADALLAMPTGSVTHDEITGLALALLSDLHVSSLSSNGAAINAKVKSLELLLKVVQDKRESEKSNNTEGATLLDLLNTLR